MDFDVHHGNGTENIVGGDQRILMVSFSASVLPRPAARAQGQQPVNVPVPEHTDGAAVRDIVNNHWLPRLGRTARS